MGGRGAISRALYRFDERRDTYMDTPRRRASLRRRRMRGSMPRKSTHDLSILTESVNLLECRYVELDLQLPNLSRT
jgi:hypothetical protein